jgi:hypothetical protein
VASTSIRVACSLPPRAHLRSLFFLLTTLPDSQIRLSLLEGTVATIALFSGETASAFSDSGSMGNTARGFGWRHRSGSSLLDGGANEDGDAPLGRDLDQAIVPHSARLNTAKSEVEAPFNWIRNLPWRPSTSRVHLETDCVCGATGSTNAGEPGCPRTSPAVATRRLRSSHATCNSLAVRLIPSFRATSTAADQSSAGIRAFPLRMLLHSRTPSCFFQGDNGSLATSHRRPPHRISGGRTTLTVIDAIIHASLPQTHLCAGYLAGVPCPVVRVAAFSTAIEVERSW